MKLIKLAFISFLVLFLIVTGFSLLIPSAVTISKAINIAADYDTVYKKISNMNDWKYWYPPVMDTTKVIFLKEDGSMLETGNTIISITERKSDEVIATMETAKAKSVIAGWKLIRYNQKDSITVQSYMNFKLKWYPWEKFSSMFFEGMYGTQMEQGLSNLKNLAEAAIRQ